MALNAQDPQAEQALLGVTMTGQDDAIAAFLSVPLEAYWSARHRAIAAVMQDMAARYTPIDPTTVGSSLEESGDLHKVGGLSYVHTLFAALYAPGNARWYAERICELYGRRTLAEACQRQLQLLDAEWHTGLATDVEESIRYLTTSIADARRWSAGAAIIEPANLDELLGEEDQHDWLVPGLLERADRTVITGEEGLGKSELITQIALTLAAGMHPFTGRTLESPGLRVMIVDCENSRSQSRRRYRRIVDTINTIRQRRSLPDPDWKTNLRIDFRTEGMDLLGSPDAAYLESIVSRVAPDLLVLGPLYKLHSADINDEAAARELVRVIDQVRVRHRCAVLTEAHAGHSKDGGGGRAMRPRGSSMFLGWPEFGFGLRANPNNTDLADLVAWRGQREERDWPITLRRGNRFELPWTPTSTG